MVSQTAPGVTPEHLLLCSLPKKGCALEKVRRGHRPGGVGGVWEHPAPEAARLGWVEYNVPLSLPETESDNTEREAGRRGRGASPRFRCSPGLHCQQGRSLGRLILQGCLIRTGQDLRSRGRVDCSQGCHTPPCPQASGTSRDSAAPSAAGTAARAGGRGDSDLENLLRPRRLQGGKVDVD